MGNIKRYFIRGSNLMFTKWIFFVILILALLTFSYLMVDISPGWGPWSISLLPTPITSSLTRLPNSPAYLVYTTGCKIPDFHPFDETISSYVKHKNIIKCGGKPFLVDIVNATILQINRNVLNLHYGKNLSYCTYTPVYRVTTKLSDNDYQWKQSITFNDSLKVKQEFGKIECYTSSKKKIYEDFHAFILKKDEVEKRCKKKLKKHQTQSPNKDYLSVLIVAIDSVSRLNFLRHCPKTHKYLETDMNAIVLKAYNKVADNTFVNMVPLLTGKYAEELPWDETMLNLPFDNYSFIWNNFSEIGYRTLFAEDAPTIATFNYNKVGFRQQPTDYYFRPFALALEKSDLRKKSKYHCVGPKLEASMMLDYAQDFAETFKDELYFGFTFVGRLTHDDLAIVATVEEPSLKFLKYINSNQLLNNTVLIFMSDHGIRFGKLRSTYIGMLEERLPFYYLIFPKWFHTKYPKIINNLRINERRLSTPFDIFATLRNILNFDGQLGRGNTSERAISLFDEIPGERTCEEASIETHWCTCQEHKPVATNDSMVLKAAAILISQINNYTEPYRNICSILTFENVESARVSVHKENFLKFGDTWDLNYKGERKLKLGKVAANAILNYLLIIKTSPNNGIFEGTIKYIEETKKLGITGDLSRINLYGNQSTCLNVNYLKKFCYCTTTT